MNANVLREIVRCALSFFRGSIRKNLSPTYLFSDLKSFGNKKRKTKKNQQIIIVFIVLFQHINKFYYLF